MAIGGGNPFRAAQPTVGRFCALVTLTLAATLSWAGQHPTTKPDAPVSSGLDDNGLNPYSKLTNEQLGTLAGTFEDLDRDERRWFLTEVRKRMSAKGNRPKIEVDKDDRFGRAGHKVGRTRQESGDASSTVGALSPPEENVEATKVYGTGVRSQREETADGSTSTIRSEGASEPNG